MREKKDYTFVIICIIVFIIFVICMVGRINEMSSCMKEMESKGYSYYEARARCNDALGVGR